jgi:hypothetical protein
LQNLGAHPSQLSRFYSILLQEREKLQRRSACDYEERTANLCCTCSHVEDQEIFECPPLSLSHRSVHGLFISPVSTKVVFHTKHARVSPALLTAYYSPTFPFKRLTDLETVGILQLLISASSSPSREFTGFLMQPNARIVSHADSS